VQAIFSMIYCFYQQKGNSMTTFEIVEKPEFRSEIADTAAK
jgi:hypothetical protein